MRQLPAGVEERIALLSVSATLRAGGVWLGPEKIAFYRALRPAAEDESLARDNWAVRRLVGQNPSALDGLRTFLGRAVVGSRPRGRRPVGRGGT